MELIGISLVNNFHCEDFFEKQKNLFIIGQISKAGASRKQILKIIKAYMWNIMDSKAITLDCYSLDACVAIVI